MTQKASFKPQWYQKYPYMYKDVDIAFCQFCIKTIKLGNISAKKSEETFTKTRFQSEKIALEKNSGIARHNDSNSHKKASEDLMKTRDYDTKNVDELLDDEVTTTRVG